MVAQRLESLLQERHLPYVTLLLSEIFPGKLALFRDVDAYALTDWLHLLLTSSLRCLASQLGASGVSAPLDRLGLCVRAPAAQFLRSRGENYHASAFAELLPLPGCTEAHRVARDLSDGLLRERRRLVDKLLRREEGAESCEHCCILVCSCHCGRWNFNCNCNRQRCSEPSLARPLGQSCCRYCWIKWACFCSNRAWRAFSVPCACDVEFHNNCSGSAGIE